MSVSLFSRTIGLQGEDTSTEVLGHLLSPESLSVPFQKLFFLRACGVPRSSADLNVELVLRPRCERGTPDALILTEGTVILLENKLGAPLSGENQLVKYVSVLASDAAVAGVFPTFEPARIKRRVLIFLAPRASIKPSFHATDLAVCESEGKNFDAICTDKGIVVVPLAWEDVFADLDDGNALQRELRLYVQDYLDQELTMREKNLLGDKDVPAAIEKLFKKVTTIRDSLAAAGFSQGRMGQSYNYFGFSVEHKSVSLWFGYSLPEWSRHGAPAILQLRKRWIKGAEEPLMAVVKELQFVKDEKAEWILPFEVSTIETWDVRLREVLLRIATAAQDPAPRQESVGG
jgi:hypothetical protein